MSEPVLLLLLAVVLDIAFGEPPPALHPVVLMGRFIGWSERHAPVSGPGASFVYGAFSVLAGLGITLLLASLALAALSAWQPFLALLVGAWLLKTTFAFRALVSAAHAVQKAIRAANLPEARRLLSWHLVSRDTSQLNERLVVAATIESVAENFGDGFVAPLLFFVCFGVPGALAYRFANTADAMLGYRDARREHLGKFAARLDDLLNWIPARLAAVLLVPGAALAGEHPLNAWRTMLRDHARTASPNAGWPMSAMAGALAVTLEKISHYVLGNGAGALDAQAVERSLRVLTAAAALSVCLILSLLQVSRW